MPASAMFLSCVACLGRSLCLVFFFNDTATTEIYTLSLHDALPIYHVEAADQVDGDGLGEQTQVVRAVLAHGQPDRSEEHTSELQSHLNLVCRLLLEKKTKILPFMQPIRTTYDQAPDRLDA